MHPLSGWASSLRARRRRREVERQLEEVVARLPHEPESRCVYQHLLEEHLAMVSRGSGEAGHVSAKALRR